MVNSNLHVVIRDNELYHAVKVDNKENYGVNPTMINIISSMKHPNIIKAYEIWMYRYSTTLIIPLAPFSYDGVMKNSLLSIDDRISILQKIISTVKYLHSLGISHGNINSNNIVAVPIENPPINTRQSDPIQVEPILIGFEQSRYTDDFSKDISDLDTLIYNTLKSNRYINYNIVHIDTYQVYCVKTQNLSYEDISYDSNVFAECSDFLYEHLSMTDDISVAESIISRYINHNKQIDNKNLLLVTVIWITLKFRDRINLNDYLDKYNFPDIDTERVIQMEADIIHDLKGTLR